MVKDFIPSREEAFKEAPCSVVIVVSYGREDLLPQIMKLFVFLAERQKVRMAAQILSTCTLNPLAQEAVMLIWKILQRCPILSNRILEALRRLKVGDFGDGHLIDR